MRLGTAGIDPLRYIPIPWGYSSVGRASALHAEGHQFDPVYLHQKIRPVKLRDVKYESTAFNVSGRGNNVQFKRDTANTSGSS